MRKPSRKTEYWPVAFGMILILLSVSAGYGLSPQVKYKWTKSISVSSDERVYGLTTDPSGNVYLTGGFEGAVNFGLDFGATDNRTAAGDRDVFITKVNSSGTYGWTRIIGGTSSDIGRAIAADSSGNIYVTGGFIGTVDFGLDFGVSDIKTVTGLGIFIIKINPDDTYGWSITPAGTWCRGIAVDKSGNICLTGDFWGSVDFGRSFGASDVRTAVGEYDIFITKINADLTYGWTRTSGAYYHDYGNAIAVDPSGNIYVTGLRSYDPGNNFPIVIIKINANGTWGWGKLIDGLGLASGGAGRGTGIVTDGSGNVFVAGEFQGTVDFGKPFGTTGRAS